MNHLPGHAQLFGHLIHGQTAVLAHLAHKRGTGLVGDEIAKPVAIRAHSIREQALYSQHRFVLIHGVVNLRSTSNAQETTSRKPAAATWRTNSSGGVTPICSVTLLATSRSNFICSFLLIPLKNRTNNNLSQPVALAPSFYRPVDRRQSSPQLGSVNARQAERAGQSHELPGRHLSKPGARESSR